MARKHGDLTEVKEDSLPVIPLEAYRVSIPYSPAAKVERLEGGGFRVTILTKTVHPPSAQGRKPFAVFAQEQKPTIWRNAAGPADAYRLGMGIKATEYEYSVEPWSRVDEQTEVMAPAHVFEEGE